jgi:O-antigen ligase
LTSIHALNAAHVPAAPSIYSARMLDTARVSALIAAAALPFSTAGTNIFALLAVLLWAVSGEWRSALRRVLAEPTAWISCLLASALVAGAFWSLAPIAEALRVAWKYRELALFCIIMFLFGDARWRARLIGTLFISTLTLLLLSFALHFAGAGQEHDAVLKKSSITQSFMMSVLAFGSAAEAMRTAGWRRWALVLVALVAVLNVLVAVQGRTGYVVLAALIVFLSAARWSGKGVAAALIAVALMAAAAYQFAPAFQARLHQTLAETREYREQRVTEEKSIALRLHYLRRSVEWLSARPLAGAGTGGWSEAFFEATVHDPPVYHDRAHRHPHNEYLHLAVQLGLGGLFLFLVLLAAAYRQAGRLPEREALLAQGFVVAFAVGCLFNDFLWDSTEGHLWALLGGALFGAARATRA